MDKTLFKVEIYKTQTSYVFKIESESGGTREYKSASFEEALEQVVNDVQEEYLEGQ